MTVQRERPQEDQRKRPNAERLAPEPEEGASNLKRTTNAQHTGTRDTRGGDTSNTMAEHPVDHNFRADMFSRNQRMSEEHEEIDVEDVPDLVEDDSDSDSDTDSVDNTTAAETD